MIILVAYDVNTETPEGRRRLRRVAKVCLNYGQRVQKSVFECRVDKLHFEKLERNLVAEIDKSLDNLRLYRLAEPVQQYSREYGNFKATDFEEPLII